MENIGTVIRNHRVAKKMTQEELGKRVFVSKQAVSKWETGRTMPDIETVRKLCDILEINKDEILGGSMEETRKSRKWLKVCVAATVISILAALFFGFGGLDYIDRHTQSGVAYLSVFLNGELLPADEYSLSGELESNNLINGYKMDIGYGQIRGMIHLPGQYEVEYGFVNINNWHHIQIRLDIELRDGHFQIRQTVSYETDNDVYQVIVTESESTEKSASVFHEGI